MNQFGRGPPSSCTASGGSVQPVEADAPKEQPAGAFGPPIRIAQQHRAIRKMDNRVSDLRQYGA
jgi:hypothetical protein